MRSITMSTNIKKALENLSYECIDAMPVDIDWREALGENCEGWRSFYPYECDECGLVHVLGAHGETRCSDEMPEIETDDGKVDNVCNGYLNSEGPAMNSWYPIRLDPEDAARAIDGLTLCAVEFEDGQTGLALTGGGMDLSWEICEAFILLGFFPPFHFAADLPDMAGKHRDPSAQLVLAAAAATCRAVSERATRAWARVERQAAIYAEAVKAEAEAE